MFNAEVILTFKAIFDDVKKAFSEVTKGAEETSKQVKASFEDIGNSLKDVGGELTKYVTAPLVALGTVAFASANDIDNAMDNIRAGTGATGTALEELGQSLRNVLGQIPTSANDISIAFSELNTRFGITGQTLEGVTKNILEFARMTNTDVTTAVKGASDVFAIWKVQSDEMSGTLDMLWKVAQSTGISTAELFDVVTKGAPIFQQLGFSLEETAVFLANLDKAGANSNVVVVGLKTALSTLSETAEELGVPIQQLAEEKFKALQDGSMTLSQAIELFGSKAGAIFYQMAQDGTLNFEQLKNAIMSSEETIMKASEDTKSFGEIMTILKNKVELAIEPLGVALLKAFDTLLPYIEKGINFVSNLANWFAGLPSPVQQTILIIGGLVASLGPALSIIGSTINTLVTLKGAFEVLGVATGPIGLTIAIIGGLIALASAIISNWDGIKAFFSGLWENVKNVFKTAVDFIVNNTIVGIFIKAVTTITSNWDGIKAFFSGIWDNVKNAFNNGINAVKTVAGGFKQAVIEDNWKTIGTFFSNTWNGIKDTFSSMTTKVLDTVKSWVTNVLAQFTSVANGMTSNIQNSINSIVNFFTGLWDKVKNSVQAFVDKVKNAFNDLWDKLVGHSIVPDTIDGIAFEFSRLDSEILPQIDNSLEQISGTFESYLTEVTTDVQEFGARTEADFKLVGTNLENLTLTWSDNSEKVGQKIDEVSSKTTQMKSKTEDLTTTWKSFGEVLAESLPVLDTVKSVLADAGKTVVGFFDDVRSGKKTFDDFGTLLKEFLLKTLSALEVQVLAYQSSGIAIAIAQAPATLGASLGAIPGILGQTAITLAVFEGLKSMIYAMASGGIVTQPTLALVGEAGPEAVIPLNKIDKLGGEQNVNLYIGTLIADDMSLLELQRRLREVMKYEARR